jgi:CBS domain-containing protein
MYVGDLCSRDVVTVAAATGLVEVAQIMRTRHVGFLVVTADGAANGIPGGVLTDRDVVVEVVSKGIDPLSLTAGDVMSRDPLVIAADARPEHALKQMRIFGVRRTPVTNAQGRLVGVLALDDLLDWLAGTLADAAGVVRREQRLERQLRA